MMNPLSRKMFRDPMSSRKPAGILASSAPMMTAAQKAIAKNQPMKAQTGASVNTSNYMSAIAQLTQQGDVKTLTNILQDTRLPTGVRTAARDAIGSLQPKPRNVAPQVRPQVGPPTADIPSIQGPPAVTVPGYSVGEDGAITSPLTDDQLAARMSAEANVLNATQSKPPRYFDPTLTRREYDMNLQSSSPPASPSSPPASPAMTPESAALVEQAQGATSGINNIVGGAYAYPGDINKALDYAYPKPPPGSSRLDRGLNFLQRGIFATIRAPFDKGAQIAGFGQETEKFLTDPYFTPEEQAEAMIAAGQSPQGRPFGVTDTPGLDTLGVFKGDEQAKDTPSPEIVGTTDMDVEAKDITPAFTNDILAQLDPNSGLSQEERDIRARSIGADLTSQGKDIIDSDLSPKQKATDFDKLFGIEGTYEERVEKRKGFLKNLLGERSKDIRTDANYNLMMTGLLIASGESPDAMTNLAKGAAAGLAGYGEAAAEEREAARREETAVALQAVSEIGEEDARVKALKAQEAMGISAADVAFERQKLLAEQQAAASKTEAQAQRDFLGAQGDLNRIVDVYTAQLAATSKVPTINEVVMDIMATDSFSSSTVGMSPEEQVEEATKRAAQILQLITPSGGTSGDLLSFATQDEARAALSGMDTLPSQVIIGGQIVPVTTK
jgi:hypothetical protein